MDTRHGCVVCTKSGRIVAKGFNHDTRQRVGGVTVPCVHAEIAALSRAGVRWRQKRLVIVAVRVGADGGMLNSKPCMDCLNVIRRSECTTPRKTGM
jgi:cytidine deaminase